MNEPKTNTLPTPPSSSSVAATIPEGQFVSSEEFDENMSEFDARFQLLATEIANVKDIVLSLQKASFSFL